MKRTMYFKCYNCNTTLQADHKVKSLSKTHNNGKIFIDDDKKILPHDCDPKDNSVVGIAYLFKVEEID